MIKYEMTGRYSNLSAMIDNNKDKKKGGPKSILSRGSTLHRSSLSLSAEKRAEKEDFNSTGR